MQITAVLQWFFSTRGRRHFLKASEEKIPIFLREGLLNFWTAAAAAEIIGCGTLCCVCPWPRARDRDLSQFWSHLLLLVYPNSIGENKNSIDALWGRECKWLAMVFFNLYYIHRKVLYILFHGILTVVGTPRCITVLYLLSLTWSGPSSPPWRMNLRVAQNIPRLSIYHTLRKSKFWLWEPASMYQSLQSLKLDQGHKVHHRGWI